MTPTTPRFVLRLCYRTFRKNLPYKVCAPLPSLTCGLPIWTLTAGTRAVQVPPHLGRLLSGGGGGGGGGIAVGLPTGRSFLRVEAPLRTEGVEAVFLVLCAVFIVRLKEVDTFPNAIGFCCPGSNVWGPTIPVTLSGRPEGVRVPRAPVTVTALEKHR